MQSQFENSSSANKHEFLFSCFANKHEFLFSCFANNYSLQHKFDFVYYRSPSMLRKGDVLSRVCLSVSHFVYTEVGGTNVTISHDALDYWTSLCSPPPPDIGPHCTGTPNPDPFLDMGPPSHGPGPVSDIWWSSLKTWSNVLVFHRKDLCDAKHDARVRNFCVTKLRFLSMSSSPWKLRTIE